jgi:hypothetical protein
VKTGGVADGALAEGLATRRREAHALAILPERTGGENDVAGFWRLL